MNLLIGLIILIITFFITFFIIKFWIRVTKSRGLVVKDMNKFSKPLIPEPGGVAVIGGFSLGVLIYIFVKTFYFHSQLHFIEAFVLLLTILFACFIGFLDDVLGREKGFKQWQKLLLTVPIAIPLIVINAGHNVMSLPFFGEVNFGILYALLVIPLGIIGATNGFNILAGMNGLEAGLGIVILSSLGLVCLRTNQIWLSLIIFIMIFSLLAFLLFNKNPAKIFPGDSLTYPLGAFIASIAIIGNMEKIAVLLFIPFIIEGILKARSKFKAESFAKPNKDNSLEPYKKIYSLTHLTIKFLKKIKPNKKVYENDVVISLIILEVILSILVLIFT